MEQEIVSEDKIKLNEYIDEEKMNQISKTITSNFNKISEGNI